jgi:hypothetical protein
MTKLKSYLTRKKTEREGSTPNQLQGKIVFNLYSKGSRKISPENSNIKGMNSIGLTGSSYKMVYP